MARATVICADCGDSEFTIHGRNRRDADYQAKKLTERGWTCSACRDASTVKANAADGLPALEGTAKQVEWAERIRARLIPAISFAIREAAKPTSDAHAYSPGFDSIEPLRTFVEKLDADEVEDLVASIREETSAHDWIEWRERRPALIVGEVLERRAAALRAADPDRIAEAALAVELREACTIRPAAPVTPSAVEISIRDGIVQLSLPERHDGFRRIVKDRGFRWDERRLLWRANEVLPAGDPRRATYQADIGRTLLAEGFAVVSFDDAVRALIESGDFPPRNWKTVSLRGRGGDDHWLVVRWPRFVGDFYQRFRAIRGAKYSNYECIVPVDSADDLLDFVAENGFEISAPAQALLDRFAEARSRGQVLAIEKVEAFVPTVDEGRRPAPLAVPESVEIADDLRDDD